jgi:hypothetical protein
MTAAQFFAVDPMEQLHDEIVAFIIARHTATPRHRQVALGPSEIGHPCPRKLAMAMTATHGVNPAWDPLPSIIGVAVHKWLESAAHLANAQLGRIRWLTEIKVRVNDWLSGSADLYDIDTQTVIDYKVPGVNQFSILKANMSPTYKVQAHLYGKGFHNMGFGVKTVAILLLPRGGQLSSSYMWSEPYNPVVADEAVARYERVEAMTQAFDVRNHPERFEWIERDGYQCMFCPYFSPRPGGPTECPGDQIATPASSYTDIARNIVAASRKEINTEKVAMQ